MTETDADWPQLLTLFSGVTCVSPDLWKLVTLKCNSSAPPNLRENIPATAVCANVCFFSGIFHDQVTCFVQSQLHSAALAALAMQSLRDVELLFHGRVERQKLHKSPGGSRFHLFFFG